GAGPGAAVAEVPGIGVDGAGPAEEARAGAIEVARGGAHQRAGDGEAGGERPAVHGQVVEADLLPARPAPEAQEPSLVRGVFHVEVLHPIGRELDVDSVELEAPARR